MGMLDGKVAIITGAGRGLGREEALLMAKEGCKIVVNDLGVSHDGTGGGKVADEVVEEIKKIGGDAVGNYDSVADFDKTKAMIDQAVSAFGKIDIIVNNAGILRDKMIFNMTESDWDLIMAVHLKGTFNLCKHAGAYWRQLAKKGELKQKGRLINTSSMSGLFGNIGQANYGAAKSGIATFSILISRELSKYCTINCVVPSAATRMTIDAVPEGSPVRNYMSMKSQSGFDIYHPSNFAPLVAFLASDKAENINGEVLCLVGDTCWVFRGWHTVNSIHNNGKPFTPQLLAERVESELLKDIPPVKTTPDNIRDMFTR